MQIQAAMLSAGDVIIERNANGVRKATVKRRRFDTFSCTGVHVDILTGGTWCYDRDAMVEVN